MLTALGHVRPPQKVNLKWFYKTGSTDRKFLRKRREKCWVMRLSMRETGKASCSPCCGEEVLI